MDQELQNKLDSIFERLSSIESEIASIKKNAPQPPVRERVAVTPPLPPVKVQKREPVAAVYPHTSLESAIGTRWIGRIGIVALIFGIGFFLKYSFDNRLIGETGRILLGIFWGVALVGAGEYFQKKRSLALYGQVLTGGGLAILYFSMYAAFAFYHLISQGLAFAAFLCITTTGITLSIRYSALSIAVIGMLGGFLTPLFLSTGENKPVALFSYILILDIGMLCVAYYKKWSSLALTSLVSTILVYTAWHLRFYVAVEQQMLSFCIVSAFFLLYHIFIIVTAHHRQGGEYSSQALAVIATAFYFLSFYVQTDFVNDWYLKSFSIGIAFIHLLFADFLLRIAPKEKLIPYSYIGMSMVLAVIAVFIVMEREFLSVALAAEMVVFYFIGERLNKPLLRYAAYAVGVLVILRFFSELTEYSLSPFEQYTLIFNTRFLVCSAIVAAFYLLLIRALRNANITSKEEFVVPWLFIVTQCLSVVLISVEFLDFYGASLARKAYGFAEISYVRQLALSIIWALYASALVVVGIVKKVRIVRLLGILLFGITTVKAFFFDLSGLETLYRIISFLVLGLVLLIMSYLYNRYKHYIFGDSES